MRIKDFTVQDSKMKIKEFWKIAKEKTHLKDIYKCMFFRIYMTIINELDKASKKWCILKIIML